MALQIIFTDGTGAQGLQVVFGAFINTAVADTYNDRVLAQQAAANAQGSASAAAASASAASTSASNASSSASAAAASATAAATSATNASNSASAAATSATNAANSATSASGSASAASTSATNAANSATAAANSASAAAATLANALTKANNLSDVASPTAATGNLRYLQGSAGSTSRPLPSKFGDILSVSDFGAPTGTDDTAAFTSAAQAAIAGNSQAVANPGWPSPNWAFAFIPPGTYTLSSPVDVANTAFVWFAAPGAVINGPQYLNGRLERMGSKVTSQSSGITDNATTFTVAANQNIDEQAQVSGFTNPNQLSAGNGRDTVAMYIGNTLPPPLYSAGTVSSYSSTGAVLSTSMTSTQLKQMRAGMLVTTQHTPQPYVGVVTAWTATSITVSAWYLVTGTSGGAPTTPTGTNGLDINTFRKVWAVNGNAFIAPSSYGSAINTVEWGMSNTKGAPQSQSGSVEANGVYMTNLAGTGAYSGDAAFFASGGNLSGGGWTWGYKADGGIQVPFYYNGAINASVAATWLMQAVNPSGQTFFTAGPDGSLNLGPQGASNTTTISFHSGATNVAYDSQINASGGNGSAGGGTLGLYASTLNLNGSSVINAGTVLRPSTDNAFGLGQAGNRWSSIYGVSGNFTNLSASGTLTGFPGRLLNVQKITSTGTYTPTTGTNSVIIYLVGGGGGSGGAAATGAGQVSIGTCGSAGGMCIHRATSGFSGVTVTIGGGGAGGAAGNNVGSVGGNSTFGAILTAGGGLGGNSTGVVSSSGISGGAGSLTVSSGGNILNTNAATPYAVAVSTGAIYTTMPGNMFMPSAVNLSAGSTGGASAGVGFGGGAVGPINGASAAAAAGAAGAPGACIIYEYS